MKAMKLIYSSFPFPSGTNGTVVGFLTVIAVKQRYPGHARQTGLVASQCQGAAYLGRFVVVVDEDIDVHDINDVLWAMCSRADPVDATEIIRRCLEWSAGPDHSKR